MDKRKLISICMLTCVLILNCMSRADSELKESYPATPTPSFHFERIPKGSFFMGSPEEEANRDSADSEHLHRVTISQDFEMGATEVTQMQWFSVMGDNPSYFSEKNYCPDEHVVISGTKVKVCPRLPVESVSWDDVQVFLEKINKRGTGSFRLPTEAEWEYAARAGTTTPFNLGEYISPDKVNYHGSYPYKNAAEGQYRQQTIAVGSLENANTWGLSDMHGNVEEWTSDWAGWYDLSPSASTDPQGARTGWERIFRGGSWPSMPWYCRSASRDFAVTDSSASYRGFRLVKPAP